MVSRGDVWLVALDPTVGHEIQKTRPCLILSPPEMHDYLGTVIVVPLTTGSKAAHFRVSVDFDGKRGRIILDQIRTIDKTRLVKRLGQIDESVLIQTLETLQEVFYV